MSAIRLIAITALALFAFAGNSLLCRAALQHTPIDAASFTTIRMVSGALTLWLLVQFTRREAAGRGSWPSALALFAYAAAFSFAYVSLPAGTGALLLFGSVQTGMIGWGLFKGERFSTVQWGGLLLALAGLLGLLLPGLSAPPLGAALLMVTAGLAWSVYSLRGRGAGDPTRVTAGNFVRTVPVALFMSLLFMNSAQVDTAGALYAVASGAITSGLGYAIWYTGLPHLKATSAATLQLSVPVIAAMGGIAWLGEPLTLRLLLASAAILGGIALVIRQHR
ncbi:DMT family transporter [Curvibacter fontanus]|jgi:drug/metabolite transporter (DMT)-like permease